METLGKRVVIGGENFVGPFDWYFDMSRGYRTFTGRFLIYDRTGIVRDYVRGRVSFKDPTAADVYLYDPPAYVGKHPHAKCLQLLAPKSKWFKLHFERPAATFGAAYAFVEHMLTEAFNLTH